MPLPASPGLECGTADLPSPGSGTGPPPRPPQRTVPALTAWAQIPRPAAPYRPGVLKTDHDLTQLQFLLPKPHGSRSRSRLDPATPATTPRPTPSSSSGLERHPVQTPAGSALPQLPDTESRTLPTTAGPPAVASARARRPRARSPTWRRGHERGGRAGRLRAGTAQGPCVHINILKYVSGSVVSYSLRPPWTVACEAPLSMEMLKTRILEWVAHPFSSGSS